MWKNDGVPRKMNGKWYELSTSFHIYVSFPIFPQPQSNGNPRGSDPKGFRNRLWPNVATWPWHRGRGALSCSRCFLSGSAVHVKISVILVISLKNIFIHLPKFSTIFCFWNFQSSMCFGFLWCIRIQTDDSLDENSGAELWFQRGWEFWGPQSNGRILSNFSDSSECQIWERGAGDSRVRLRQGLRNSTIHFIWFHYHPL